jgi:hypothetical protein|tara:strand:+ start:471 stop:644 length:174 start_codon:yes stop_codon:yes gene_type:complete
MQVGDLVKLWVNAEWYVIGILVEKDTRTYPEKVFVRTQEGQIVDGYDDECEVISAAG